MEVRSIQFLVIFEGRNWLYSVFLSASTTLLFFKRGGGDFAGDFLSKLIAVLVVSVAVRVEMELN